MSDDEYSFNEFKKIMNQIAKEEMRKINQIEVDLDKVDVEGSKRFKNVEIKLNNVDMAIYDQNVKIKNFEERLNKHEKILNQDQCSGWMIFIIIWLTTLTFMTFGALGS